MFSSLDTVSLVTGLAIGTALGYIISRMKSAGLQTELSMTKEARDTLEQKNTALAEDISALRQEKARLENALENEQKVLAEQMKLLDQTKKQMEDTFQSLTYKALNDSRESFLALAQERFTQLQTNAQTSLKELVTPVSQSLEKVDGKIAALEKERHNAYGELREHLKAMKTDQDKLRGETASLVQALRSPSTRGQWGELQLKRTLEMAGLVEGVHFEQQVTTDDQRPDVIVKLPGGKTIVIDAKTPIDAYMDSFKDGASESERASALDRHARHVRDHIKKLGNKKYWEKFDSPEFVVMFLPGESYFSAALERDPSLIEAGVSERVIPASPTTLISLLKAVAYGWQQEKLADNAREIANLGNDLYKRLCTFGGHLEKVGKGIKSALDGYNNAVGSLERMVLPSARRFQEMQTLTQDEKLPSLDPLDQTPRSLTAPELTGLADSTSEDTGDTPLKEAKNG